jgi:3-phosphoshikimate 1-carboxyvinyltransferase
MEQRQIKPLSGRSAEVFTARVPGSKSYTNRALLIAASRPGRTQIVNALKSDDTVLLSKALGHIPGLKVEETPEGFSVDRVEEVLRTPPEPLYHGGGGTPARFMLSFVTTLQGRAVVAGNARLSERPMQDLLDAFTGMGVKWRCQGKPGCLPVEIEGGPIQNGAWSVSGAVSSQFLSSLLLLASQMTHLPKVEVTVSGHLVSKPYVDMTLTSLRDAGVRCEHQDYRLFTVYPARPALPRIVVEPDASAMSYFLVAAALTRTRVRIDGIGRRSAQGDVGIAFALEKMGCGLRAEDGFIELEGRPLKGIDLDMETMPDTVLSLAMAAAQADGWSRFTNIANLRVKECDRIHAIAAELKRLGYTEEEAPDAVAIKGGGKATPATVETYDDHRVAMSFSLLGLLHEGISIKDPKCVGKSFPSYWEELDRFYAHHQGGRA